MVIDKPAGLIVNRSDTTARVATVQDWAEIKVQSSIAQLAGKVQRDIDKEFVDRGGVVHRLDKDTSGILIIAKTPESFLNLKNQFKDRETMKTYLALVHGKVEPAFGVITAPIARSPFNRMHFGVFPGGREAQTSHKTLENIDASIKNQGHEKETLTLLKVSPHTGRTHQIRVHLKYINHPIVCDPLYCGRKTYNEDLKYFPRLFLHATSLEIKHPQNGASLKFESPLPQELGESLDEIRRGCNV